MTKKQRPCVLVTDARLPSATTVIQDLGRTGHDVVAAGMMKSSAGMWSRATTHRGTYPNPVLHPNQAVDALLALVRRHRVDLLIPITDEVIVPLSEQRDRFDGICQLALPNPEALALMQDKDATVRMAKTLGVETPRSLLVHSRDEARDAAIELGWPVVLKPRQSFVAGERLDSHTIGVTYANDFDGLDRELDSFGGRFPLLLQEYCAGEGQGVDMLLHEGRALAVFQHRRLREMPPTGGPSSLRESMTPDWGLVDRSIRLLGEVGWTGLAMAEYKVGEDGPRLMEVNGRIWGSFPLSVRSGMDFPSQLASLYLDGPPSPGPLNDHYRVGVRSRDLGLELRWIVAALRNKRTYPFLDAPMRAQGLAALAGLIFSSDRYDLLTLSDPLPALLDARRALGFFFKRPGS